MPPTQIETVHRYPRLMTWSIELLSALVVLMSSGYFGAVLLRYLWDTFGLDETLVGAVPLLAEIIDAVNMVADRPREQTLADLVPALLWMALSLFIVLLLRNALPTLRTSSRGMLVEFAGSWIPLHWGELRTVKVTSDLSSERFVLLVEPLPKHLTGWHRLYSLLYDLRAGQGFLVTSSISDFEKLVKTILDESQNAARVQEHAQAVQLDETAQSPLFRLLLSPASFFSQRTSDESGVETAEAAQAMTGNGTTPVRGTYPTRIRTFFNWIAIFLTILLIWRYLLYWAQFLVLILPSLRTVPFFDRVLPPAAYSDLATYFTTRAVPWLGVAALPNLPSPMWLLVAAHLMLVLMLGVLAVVRNLLPALEARPEGLAVQVQSGFIPNPRWKVIGWHNITAVKATELSEKSQILFIQVQESPLPLSYRINSLLYDGSLAPGILVTSAMSNFEFVMQQVLTPVAQLQAQREQEAEARGIDPPEPILQQESQSWLLRLTFKPRLAIGALIEQAREEMLPTELQPALVWRVAPPMIWVALLPAFLFLAHGLFVRGVFPNVVLGVGTGLLWLIGLLEWPLVCQVLILLDESTGGGEEGYRAFYLYPVVQLSRVLLLLCALTLIILGWPAFAIVSWVGAIILSGFLNASLWNQLYEWKGSQMVLGGLAPVLWQLLLLLVYVLVQR